MLECSRSTGAECKTAEYGEQYLKRASCFLAPTDWLNPPLLSPAGKLMLQSVSVLSLYVCEWTLTHGHTSVFSPAGAFDGKKNHFVDIFVCWGENLQTYSTALPRFMRIWQAERILNCAGDMARRRLRMAYSRSGHRTVKIKIKNKKHAKLQKNHWSWERWTTVQWKCQDGQNKKCTS